MFGHLEMRAMGMLMTAHSGVSLRSALSSPQVQWLREKGLVNDEGDLTADGRLLAHHALTGVEFALRPQGARKANAGEGT